MCSPCSLSSPLIIRMCPKCFNSNFMVHQIVPTDTHEVVKDCCIFFDELKGYDSFCGSVSLRFWHLYILRNLERGFCLKLVGKEKREAEALKLFHEEENKKLAQELLEQYLAYKKVSTVALRRRFLSPCKSRVRWGCFIFLESFNANCQCLLGFYVSSTLCLIPVYFIGLHVSWTHCYGRKWRVTLRTERKRSMFCAFLSVSFCRFFGWNTVWESRQYSN